MQSERQLELSLGQEVARRRRPRKAWPAQQWRDAAAMPFLGRSVLLRLDGACERAELVQDSLYLPLPPEAGEAQIRDRAQGWLQAEARRVLGERVAMIASRLGLPLPAWKMAFTADLAAETDADGSLRLSWRLVQLAPEEIDGRLLRQLEPLRSRALLPDFWDAAAIPA